MPTNRDIALALTWLFAILMAAVALLFSGCTHLAEWDKRIWGTPATTYTVKQPDGTISTIVTDPGKPGIFDIVATVAAALGLTGTATWISRVKKAGNGKAAQLEARLDALEAGRASWPAPPSMN